MIFNETYTLSNGVNIPKLGLGTWMIDDTSASEVVRQAVSIGYRHIDTAQAYQNNEQIAAMADKYSVSVAQLCIKYVLELGAVALPKTANPSHMKDNAMLDFTLSECTTERTPKRG
jgi:diketogulonate reductase-like aldo/keto reductase